MPTNRKVIDFKIHNLTEEQFQELKEAGQIDPNAIYCTPDETVANFEAVNARIDEAIQTEQQHNIETNARVDETVANFEEINTEIEELSEQINTKQDVATAINYSHVTNCITEIPQNLIFTVSGNTLTLKAGSKVYVPNGPDVYETQNIVEDISVEIPNDWNYGFWIFKQASANALDFVETATADVSSSSPVPGDYVEYNGTENVCGLYIESSGFARYESLPLAYITVSNGQITIDEVFDPVCYIEKYFFALPGIKMLMPNGRNVDGTLKNKYRVSESVKRVRNTYAEQAYNLLLNDQLNLYVAGLNHWQYDQLLNYYVSGNEKASLTMLGVACSSLNSMISSFEQYQPFQAASYQDLQNNISPGLVMPFAGRTPPAGWLKCDGSAVSRTRYAKLFTAIGGIYGTGDGRTTFNLPTQSVLPLGTTVPVAVYGTGKALGLKTNVSDSTAEMRTVVDAYNVKVKTSSQSTSGSIIGVETSSSISGLTGSANLANATGAKAIVCIKY